MNTLAVVFAQSGIGVAFGVTFTLLMVVAAGSDVRYRKIPNVLALATMVLGALFVTVSVGPRDAAVRVLEGAGTGFVVWIPFWALGMMGAGDVKFFAASCAWLGPRLALEAALASALLGGVLALSWLLWRAGSRCATTPNVSSVGIGGQVECDKSGGGVSGAENRDVTLPYGVAMAAGLAITAWFPHLMH
jgi:prepilin peptidase CpaA